MNKKLIKAIFFDLDDTLFATSKFARDAHMSAVKAMVDAGVKMSVENLFQELLEVRTEFSSNYPQHFNKLLVRIPQETHNHVNKAILIASAVVAYHDTKYASLKAYTDAISVLDHLSKRKVIVGIITAGLEIKQAEKLVRLKIYPYISPGAIFISDQIGISKPNKKIFKYACEHFQLQPEEAVYIGDNPKHDIDPPNQLGMITVRVKKGGKYNSLQGETKADYQISDFSELLPKLEQDFIIPE